MRCRNCGWENPSGSSKCEKCNAPLSGTSSEGASGYASERRNYESIAENLRGTVSESGAGQQQATDGPVAGQGGMMTRRECGYPAGAGMNVCPNCGASLRPDAAGTGRNERESLREAARACSSCGKPMPREAKYCPSCGTPAEAQARPLRMGTVNAWETPLQSSFCTLRPIAWKGEGVEHGPMSYSGDTIALNRANTDPNNHTITSKEQAVLIREGDSWYIEDRSEQHTTLVRVSRRLKLEDGDVIVLGNRMFEFKG